MSETAREPEAKTPFETSIDEFYKMVRNDAASGTQIAAVTSIIVQQATLPGFDAQRRIDNWADRHQYDSEGIVMDSVETSEEIILTRKTDLVCDMTAFLVGSDHSFLSDDQKEALISRATRFLEGQKLGDVADELLGAAIAPYIAHTIDMAEMADTRDPHRWAAGRFVLDVLGKHDLLPKRKRRALQKGLRAATKM